MLRLVFLFLACVVSREHYANQEVLRCFVDENVLGVLRDLEGTHGLDIWNAPVGGGYADIRVDQATSAALKSTLRLDCQTLIPDVDKAILDSTAKSSTSSADNDYFLEYHPLGENMQRLVELSVQYSELVTLIPSFGQSVEGRNMTTLRLSTENTVPGPRWQVWIEGGIHAREWITPATNLYVLHQFLEGYGTDPVITNILNRLDVYFTPHVNPDGYAYTWSTNRLWRKNRRLNAGGSYGVDLNRNFNDTRWRPGTNPNSQTWPGTGPASEPETQSIQNFIRSLPNPLSGYDIHSYGQEVYWDGDDPWFRQCGQGQIDAIFQETGTPYVGIRRTDGLNVGMAQDFFTHGALLPGHGWMYEVRDRGQYGFLLPPDQIIPVGREINKAVQFWLTTLIEQFGSP